MGFSKANPPQWEMVVMQNTNTHTQTDTHSVLMSEIAKKKINVNFLLIDTVVLLKQQR